jgi:hypothetical protein
LRQRLAESPELRELLLTQLQMETYLTTALGRVNLSPQQIIARAQQHQQSPFGVVTILALLLCLPLVAIFGAYIFNAVRKGAPDTTVAEAPPTAPVDDGQPKAVRTSQANDSAAQPPVASGANTVSPAAATAQHPSTPKSPPIGSVPPAPPPTPKLPWQAALDFAGQPPPYQEVAFQTFATSKLLPRVADLKPWLSAVPGHNHRLTIVDTQAGKCAAFEGLARLNSPWLNEACCGFAGALQPAANALLSRERGRLADLF